MIYLLILICMKHSLNDTTFLSTKNVSDYIVSPYQGYNNSRSISSGLHSCPFGMDCHLLSLSDIYQRFYQS